MRRALSLARRGLGRVSPNPMVGCVLARGGRVVGEGWHSRFGGPHAEAVALRRAGAAAAGSTAYVTLEPCRHHGKTPPCTRALIAARVRRVVAAALDPDPRMSGRGLRELSRAGVAAGSGLLEGEARALNAAYFTRALLGRPRVTLKAGCSLDGRIASAGGESEWITSERSRSLSRRLRGRHDAVVAGVGTVLADDPRLTSPGAPRAPVRVVLDTRLRTPPSARVLDASAPTLVATASRRTPPWARRPSVSLLRVPRGRGGLDLRALLRRLSARGVDSVLVEGGGRVHASFLEAGLADELRLFIAPRLIGGSRAPSFLEGRGFRLKTAPRLERMRIRRIGEDILIEGAIRPGPEAGRLRPEAGRLRPEAGA